MSFFEEIKKNAIKTPTQRGFSEDKWIKCWETLKSNASARDEKLYKAGLVFFRLLEEIRLELHTLYKEHAPDITNTQLLVAFISVSNRERAILSESRSSGNFNLHSSTISNNAVGNEITFQEVCDGSVDALEKAIFFCKIREKKSQEIKKGKKPLGIMEFIAREIRLSHLYSIYENYWHAILWNDFELIELNKEKKLYLIQQPLDKYQVSARVSQIRKSRLSAQSVMISGAPEILKFHEEDRYVSIKKTGRKNRLFCKEVKKSDDEIITINSDWKIKSLFLIESFDEESLNKTTSLGFSLMDALEVFRNLVILSLLYSRKYPKDTSAFNYKKLGEFCPNVNKNELHVAISKSTGFEMSKVVKIFSFLGYTASEQKDLWCHPVVSISKTHYALCTSALLTPVIDRVVEHWLVSLDIDLKDKGIAYERFVLQELNDAVRKNSKIKDYNRATSGRLKVNDLEEEIDLIFRVGNVILIGEAKSIVTSDSPISQYRTIKTLEYASKQVKRKTDFVRDNLNSVFEKLNWNYDPTNEYRICNCILNSGRMFVGLDIDGVPVCDEKILINYFQTNIVPLASTIDIKTRSPKHLAWAVLYNNFTELQNNLRKYLYQPPQIFESEKHFEYKTMQYPYKDDRSYKLIFRRFIPKDISVKDRVDIDIPFFIEKISNYDDEVKGIDFIV